ncbi:MAG: uracil-DNA glycosylase [Saprospiraceae bacterium]
MPSPVNTDSQRDTIDVKLETSWKKVLASEFSKPYFHNLMGELRQEEADGNTFYPKREQIYEAFAKTPFKDVKVIILGQDPYHNPGEAMGLSFSVPKGVKVPPSLRNIYKELIQDVGFEFQGHGDLTAWADQGVFLLNTILTVRHKTPKSHKKFGWHFFTDAVIQTLSKQREGLVFMLWGASAKAKAELIDESKHLVLQAAHPSPLARGAYFGSKHFSKANTYLTKHGKSGIDWTLPA